MSENRCVGKQIQYQGTIEEIMMVTTLQARKSQLFDEKSHPTSNPDGLDDDENEEQEEEIATYTY